MSTAGTKPVDPSVTVIEDSTCTFCGCVCDDIDITVKDNHIIEAKRACVLGKSWFFNHHADDRPSCLIEGRAASVAEGVDRRLSHAAAAGAEVRLEDLLLARRSVRDHDS